MIRGPAAVDRTLLAPFRRVSRITADARGMAYSAPESGRTVMRKLYRVYEADRDGTDYCLFLECE